MTFLEKPQTVKQLFRMHWTLWKLLGAVPNTKYAKLYKIYSIFLNIIFSIGYPLHLVLGLWGLITFEERCLNLTLTIPVVVCTLKFYNLWRNFGKIRQLENMFDMLYARITQPDEWKYYEKIAIPNTLRTLNVFCLVCGVTAITTELTFIIMGFIDGWRLLSSGYFPFDPYANAMNFVMVHIFQICGFLVQICENVASDTYGAMCLALLGGHAHLLGKRVASIGYDESKTQRENNEELLKCIADHNLLFACHRTISEIIGFGMFIQILSASVIMGIVVIFMVFYVTTMIEYFNYAIFLIACVMEVFPTCYYGTYFESEFDKLTYMLFSCNWMDQSREFKKNLGIAVEQSLKKRRFLVGGMFRINLNIFFATCKGAYSLLTVALRMK